MGRMGILARRSPVGQECPTYDSSVDKALAIRLILRFNLQLFQDCGHGIRRDRKGGEAVGTRDHNSQSFPI